MAVYVEGREDHVSRLVVWYTDIAVDINFAIVLGCHSKPSVSLSAMSQVTEEAVV